MRLEDLGYNTHFASHFAQYEPEGFRPGRITLEHKSSYMLYTEHGEMPAVPTGRMHFAADEQGLPVVGDWVVARVLDENPARAVISAILPRKSKFSRKQAGEKTVEQPIAANIDIVFIVVGLDSNYSVRRIERYLTLTWESGARPVVLLTKSDLCDAVEERLSEVRTAAPEVPVHAVSVFNESGLECLRDYLTAGHTVALLGSSGVGKSTLTNFLLGKDIQRTQEVRDMDSKGRHTTTSRQMFVLPPGGLVIDTPGMRELQLWNADDGLSETFRDIEEIAHQCRFPDCSHRGEPGCAVRQALDDGTLDPARFENHQKMLRELEYLTRRRDTDAARTERLKWKNIHKEIKKINKKG